MSETLNTRQRAGAFELSLDLAIVCDSAGTILDASPSWHVTLGYHRAELLNTKIFALIHADDHAPTAAEIDKLMAGRLTAGFENRYRHKDGSYRWIIWTASCDTSDGSILGIGRDITELREYTPLIKLLTSGEIGNLLNIARDSSPSAPPGRIAGSSPQIEAVRQACHAQFQLAAVVQQSADSIVLTDESGAILYVNPAFERITGYSKQEALGKNPRILQSGRHDEAFYRTMWDTLRAGKTWVGRMINKSKAGTLFEEDCTLFAVQGPEGRLLGYAAIKRDVTQRTALEQQLRQAQKMEIIGRLAGGVAHDFNNLLTVINGYSELIQDQLAPTHPLREQVEIILRTGQRAATLTKNLLVFSRKQLVEVRRVDLNDVVRDSTKMLGRILGEDIDLTVSLDEAPCFVLIDAGQITQVVLNLVVNARDAMPQGGRVTLRTRAASVPGPSAANASPATVQLSVADNGCGMSDHVKSHLFEAFFTTKPEGRGTGLGLATAHGIVTQAGGTITVQSELGVGSTFTVDLPGASTADAPRVRTAARARQGQGEVILLVEDDEMLRALSRHILEHAGYEVLEASSEGDAVLLSEQHSARIQLVLTDVVMPRLSGPALVARIRPFLPHAKIRFFSGYASHQLLDELEGGRSVALLRKPFSRADLIDFVGRAISAGPEVVPERDRGTPPEPR